METRPTAKSEYIAGIDGLRALAVLAVIAYHFESTWLPGGFTGVDVFFVISGFVISKSLASNYTAKFSTFTLEFYKKRILRIMPALLVCLLVTGVVSSLFIPEAWLSSKNDATGAAAFFGLSNFPLLAGADGYFSERVAFNPFTHTWSLAVEEQFYVIFPAIFFIWLKIVHKTSSSHNLWTGVFLAIVASSLAFSYYETTYNQPRAFYLLPSRFWELGAGVLLFQSRSRISRLIDNPILTSTLSWVGLSLIAVGLVSSTEENFPFPWALAPVTGTVLLVASMVNTREKPDLVQRVFQIESLRYIGKISYSLYLWHWPVITMFRWTVGLSGIGSQLIAALIISTLSIASYHLVEIPIRQNPTLKKLTAWKVILGAGAVTLLAFTFTTTVFSKPWRFNQSTIVGDRDWDAYAKPLNTTKSHIENSKFSDATLYVVGDSHAQAYSMMLNTISSRLGIEVIYHTSIGCPIVNLQKPDRSTKRCKKFLSKTVNSIEASAKPGDIVFFASLRSNRLANQWGPLSGPVLNEAMQSPIEKANRHDAYHQASTLILKLQDLNLNVLIDTPKPIFKAPPFRCADWFNNMNPVCKPGFEIDRDYLLNHNKPILEVLKKLKQEHPFLHIWDPFPVLCANSPCSAFEEGKPLFFDSDHLSGFGNRRLVPSFEEKIEQILKQGT